MSEGAPGPSGPRSELGKRVVSGVILAVLALGAVALGGWPFVLFWGAAALGVFWEWEVIVAEGAILSQAAGAIALGGAALAAGLGQFDAAMGVLAVGAIAALGARYHRAWHAAGIAYAGALLLAPILLRNDHSIGIVAVMFLFAVVWATDIFGFFVGRAIGGPKLLSRVSPNKTWSGAVGGAGGALVAGLLVVHVAGGIPLVAAACVALVLSVVSQAGDLLESAMKRRFGVKDAGHLIPGHGGLMDRLDGFVAAAAVAALVGLARGGTGAAARGLLVW